MNILTELLGRLRALIMLPLMPGADGDDPGGCGPWLIGENQGECLEDNGYAFYRHCREVHPEKRVYFLISRASPFYASRFAGDENAVIYGSARHMRLFARASVMFYTHTYRDVMYRRFFEIFGRKKKLIYLHHGTLGFKKFDPFYYRNRNVMEIFTVGSALERDILVDQAGVDEHRVKVTGYARADLLQGSKPLARQILYIPTHRRHLQGQDRAHFIGRIEALLGSPVLVNLLERHNITLKVYLHAHTQKTLSLGLAPQPRIELVRVGQESVRQLICQSQLMITDYSSVCWDFLSLAKPVLFYRFDLEHYAAARDSYIDLEDESFGEIAYEEERLLELLSQYLEGGRSFDRRILQSSGIVEAGGDGANCERIYSLATDVQKTQKLKTGR